MIYNFRPQTLIYSLNYMFETSSCENVQFCIIFSGKMHYGNHAVWFEINVDKFTQCGWQYDFVFVETCWSSSVDKPTLQ